MEISEWLYCRGEERKGEDTNEKKGERPMILCVRVSVCVCLCVLMLMPVVQGWPSG